MEALFIKNDMWAYVSGSKTKPEITVGDTTSRVTAEKWETEDRKAKANIILCINPSKLKQVKGCTTSRQVKIAGNISIKGTKTHVAQMIDIA